MKPKAEELDEVFTDFIEALGTNDTKQAEGEKKGGASRRSLRELLTGMPPRRESSDSHRTRGEIRAMESWRRESPDEAQVA